MRKENWYVYTKSETVKLQMNHFEICVQRSPCVFNFTKESLNNQRELRLHDEEVAGHG